MGRPIAPTVRPRIPRALGLAVSAALALSAGRGALAQTGVPLEVPLTLVEPSGVARPAEPVTMGIPLGRDAGVTTIDHLGIFVGPVEIPAQFRVLSRWDGPLSDASLPIRWVLADFQVDLLPNETKVVTFRNTGSGNSTSGAIAIDFTKELAFVQTGGMTVTLPRQRGNLIDRVLLNGQIVADDGSPGRDRSGVTLVDGDRTVYRTANSYASIFTIEEWGGLRLTIRVESRLETPGNAILRPNAVKVVHRLTFYANKTFIRIQTQLENNAMYGLFNGNVSQANILDFDSLVLDVPIVLTGPPTFRTTGVVDLGTAATTWRVLQTHAVNNQSDETQNFSYDVRRDGTAVGTGGRHPGWVSVGAPNGSVTAGVRWFWQNYEKAFRVSRNKLTFELWPSDGFYPPTRMPQDHYQFEGSRHKGHEMLLEFAASPPADPSASMTRFEHPVIGRASGAWYAGTGALGMMDSGQLVFSGTDDDTRMNAAYARYNELMRKRANGLAPDSDRPGPVRNVIEAKEHRFKIGTWEFADWYGWPHFGDVAWGDGYSSNHYDMPGFLLTHYLRTGDRALFDLAEPHIRQASEFGQVWGIDPNSYSASISFYEKTNDGLSVDIFHPVASHNWIRRLVLYYWMTGNRFAYEAAMFNAQALWRNFYQAWNITNPASIGFVVGQWSPLVENRFISWTLDNILEVWALTGEAQWRTMTEDLARCFLYIYQHAGHLDGPGPHLLGRNGMSLYATEPLVRFHHASANAALREQILTVLRAMITNTFEIDRLAPQGSNTSYLPASLLDDWNAVYPGPDSIETILNGMAASLYAYVGWIDGNQGYLMTAHRLWADGVYYPEYTSGYPNRAARNYNVRDPWGWSSAAYPGADEKVFSRETREGIPYLYVMSRINAGETGLMTRVGTGAYSQSDKTFWVGDSLSWLTSAAVKPEIAGRAAALFVNFPPYSAVEATTPLGIAPFSPAVIPAFHGVHALSLPPGIGFLAGDSLGLGAAGIGFAVGLGGLHMESSPLTVTVPPGIFSQGDSIRLQALYLEPESPIGLATTNEVRFVAKDPALP